MSHRESHKSDSDWRPTARNWALFGRFKIASRHIYQLFGAIEVMNIGDDDDDASD